MPRPVGRPTTYKKKYCQLLIDHMKKGLSFEAFGAVADVSKETLYTWTEKHSEFLDAKRRGEQHSRLLWESIGLKASAGQISGFSASAWIFNMKNRFRWSDRMEIEQTTLKRPEIPDDVSGMTDAELAQRYKQALGDES